MKNNIRKWRSPALRRRRTLRLFFAPSTDSLKEIALEFVHRMPSYVGIWTTLGRAVFIEDDEELRALRLAESALARGYAWGRAGSGPREVARAILLDATGNGMLAERLCRPFTWEVVSRLPPDGFRLNRGEVLAWVEEKGRTI